MTRARIVLRSAEGVAIGRVADELGVGIMTVKLWRRRYAQAGLAGLADAPRPGHPPTYTREDRDRGPGEGAEERLNLLARVGLRQPRRIAASTATSRSNVRNGRAGFGQSPGHYS